MPTDARTLTLVSSLIASVVLVTCALRGRPPAEALVVAEPRAVEDVAAERSRAAAPDEDPPLWRYWLSEEHARKVFAFPDDRRYDPWVYFLDTPDRADRVEWPEHPDGFYVHRTNRLGYRDDEPGPPADREIFVVGDSNSAGVCNVDENYSNRLECLLRAERPGETVSVTNLSTGGYGMHNYVGAIEKALASPPDVFVVAVFGGNDFAETLPLNRILSGGSGINWKKARDVNARRIHALEDELLLMTHGFNSALIFKTFPDREALAGDVAVRLVGEMKAACDSVGTRLVLLYIPEPCLFEWSLPLAGSVELREFLQLDPHDCAATSRIADRLLAEAAEMGVAVVDLRPAFAALPEPPYWRKDLHMNLEAHELAAKALLEHCR